MKPEGEGTMIFRRNPTCGTCKAPKFIAQGSTVWVCPQCDRARCAARSVCSKDEVCGQVLIHGNEKACPRCGAPIRVDL